MKHYLHVARGYAAIGFFDETERSMVRYAEKVSEPWWGYCDQANLGALRGARQAAARFTEALLAVFSRCTSFQSVSSI